MRNRRHILMVSYALMPAMTTGRILIITTNHIEMLDKALIQNCRADVVVNFNNVTKLLRTTLPRRTVSALTGGPLEIELMLRAR